MPKDATEAEREQLLDQVRVALAKRINLEFIGWLEGTEERKERAALAYNKILRGFVPFEVSGEKLPLARWSETGNDLRGYQNQGARRMIENRGGICAFDVGGGKTYTGLATIAYARQKGWCRKPVIIVPKTIIWKWHRDFVKQLPDYRVCVIGSKRFITAITPAGVPEYDAENDTPDERAQKWLDFKAGVYDVAILDYESMKLSKIHEGALKPYLDTLEEVKRTVRLAKRNISRRQKGKEEQVELSERDAAIIAEGVLGWAKLRLELDERRSYDPDIFWDDIGIDWLVVDEGQNFKNLFMAESSREGKLPKFIGGSGEAASSKRAWQLAFRSAVVRNQTGGNVCILSATPAKNSPLEFYSLTHYVDHKAFARMGVIGSEAFIDRYCAIEYKPVGGVVGIPEMRNCVTGFKNLSELRGVIFKYSEFKNVKEMGLKVPEPEIHGNKPEDHIPMNDVQEERYSFFLAMLQRLAAKALAACGGAKPLPGEEEGEEFQVRDTRREESLMGAPEDEYLSAERIENPKGGGKGGNKEGGELLKYMTLMHLVAIHPALEGLSAKGGLKEDVDAIPPPAGGGEPEERKENPEMEIVSTGEVAKTKKPRKKKGPSPAQLAETIDPHSPKIDECALNVLKDQTCGHIIFCDLLAVQVWMRKVLVEAGIPDEQIATLNSTVDVSQRLQIADDFNGQDLPPKEPKYRVIIANQVAYEGIDLQRRTCAIHHLDLPYEPSTLQQRNGRAVRQGNKLDVIKIYYYLAKKSIDGYRFQLIAGKAGWMTSLVEGMKNKTNNPGAEMDLSPEEVLIQLSRDENCAKALFAEMKRQQHEMQLKAQRDLAVRSVRTAVAYFTKAREKNDTMALAKAEAMVKVLAGIPAEYWPWYSLIEKVIREKPVHVTEIGVPMWEGLTVLVTVFGNESFLEFGPMRAVGGSPGFGTRSYGSGVAPQNAEKWTFRGLTELNKYAEDWTSDAYDRTESKETWETRKTRLLRVIPGMSYVARDLKWVNASKEFLDRIWDDNELRGLIHKSWESSYATMVPVLDTDGRFFIRHPQYGAAATIKPGDKILSPGARGRIDFLNLTRTVKDRYKWRDLNEISEEWYGVGYPLSFAAKAEKVEAEIIPEGFREGDKVDVWQDSDGRHRKVASGRILKVRLQGAPPGGMFTIPGDFLEYDVQEVEGKEEPGKPHWFVQGPRRPENTEGPHDPPIVRSLAGMLTSGLSQPGVVPELVAQQQAEIERKRREEEERRRQAQIQEQKNTYRGFYRSSLKGWYRNKLNNGVETPRPDAHIYPVLDAEDVAAVDGECAAWYEEALAARRAEAARKETMPTIRVGANRQAAVPYYGKVRIIAPAQPAHAFYGASYGQTFWWIGASPRDYVQSIRNRYKGDQDLDIEIDLSPGKYTLGTGGPNMQFRYEFTIVREQ